MGAAAAIPGKCEAFSTTRADFLNTFWVAVLAAVAAPRPGRALSFGKPSPLSAPGRTGTTPPQGDKPGVDDASPTPSSAQSMAASVEDDRKLTFEQIHKKYEPKIFNLILRIIGDYEDAQDLTVETFVNAFRAWDRFRGDARVSTWLHQIAVNNCKNRFKQRDRQREREPVSLDDNISTDSGDVGREVADWRNLPEQVLMDKEFAGRLHRAVESLKPDYKVVFVLAEVDDLSYDEIARVTELTVPAVKTRLHRARNMVRQKLEPYYRNL